MRRRDRPEVIERARLESPLTALEPLSLRRWNWQNYLERLVQINVALSGISSGCVCDTYGNSH